MKKRKNLIEKKGKMWLKERKSVIEKEEKCKQKKKNVKKKGKV